MKNFYVIPEMEIMILNQADIISTSDGYEDDDVPATGGNKPTITLPIDWFG